MDDILRIMQYLDCIILETVAFCYPVLKCFYTEALYELHCHKHLFCLFHGLDGSVAFLLSCWTYSNYRLHRISTHGCIYFLYSSHVFDTFMVALNLPCCCIGIIVFQLHHSHTIASIATTNNVASNLLSVAIHHDTCCQFTNRLLRSNILLCCKI